MFKRGSLFERAKRMSSLPSKLLLAFVLMCKRVQKSTSLKYVVANGTRTFNVLPAKCGNILSCDTKIYATAFFQTPFGACHWSASSEDHLSSYHYHLWNQGWNEMGPVSIFVSQTSPRWKYPSKDYISSCKYCFTSFRCNSRMLYVMEIGVLSHSYANSLMREIFLIIEIERKNPNWL